MRTEIRAVNTIRPYEDNPRQNDGAVDAVAASLKEFGFRQPIVVDTDGVIIAGHTRYKAALDIFKERPRELDDLGGNLFLPLQFFENKGSKGPFKPESLCDTETHGKHGHDGEQRIKRKRRCSQLNIILGNPPVC